SSGAEFIILCPLHPSTVQSLLRRSVVRAVRWGDRLARGREHGARRNLPLPVPPQAPGPQIRLKPLQRAGVRPLRELSASSSAPACRAGYARAVIAARLKASADEI